MRAVSLLGVCVLAKVCVLAGREIPLSPWTPIAYFWQDLLVVLLFAALDRLVRRRWFGWAAYGFAVFYIALNVPVARVLSTPLTWPLLRAARGPLSDSIAYHATASNILLFLLVLVSAVVLPLLMRRVQPRVLAVLGVVCLPPLIALGPLATSRVETRGLHRNPLVALVTSAFPRIQSKAALEDWRASPLPEQMTRNDIDLSQFRGAAAGRNVIVVALESTAAQYLRTYGADDDPMPNLTRLAERSFLFENADAVYPESIKGLFSVLCSTYPAMDTEPEVYAKVRPPALAEVLQREGYRTGLFHSGRFMYLGMEAIVRDRGYQTLEDAGDIGGDHNSSFGVDEHSTVRRMLEWIDARRPGERFFLTYLPIAGHHPYVTPGRGPYPAEEDFDRYRNALHYADAALGQLLRGLEERGLINDTLLVLFGDHGEAFGQHEGNYAHTLHIYEENVRVPYLLALPGQHEPLRVRRPASLIDTAPTILDLLGFSIPASYQGSSLLDQKERMALCYTDYSLGLLGLRDGRWKFIHEIETNRSKLFDLEADPGERHNRAEEFPERATAYREHLLRWSAAQREHILRPR